MRLLHTSTLSLQEFIGDKIPRYAILSHRWENEEVTFQDLRSGRGPLMAGSAKIIGCCRQAVKDGWDYIWIDSCCIDKTSSAELSEAINSMFMWYKHSAICYAYLSDVHEEDPRSFYASRSSFRRSKWFTRGWTLQELLAPTLVVFFNNAWKDIGTKGSLADLVSHITGITNLFNFEDASIAQKMSWAAKRETTRIEDIAYCLLGLFSVYMPPLYGEGRHAFLRLQLEILKKSDDESIFAWLSLDGNGGSLLAGSIGAFQDSGNIRKLVTEHHFPLSPYQMTNQGLCMEFNLIPFSWPELPRPYNCRAETYRQGSMVFSSERPMLQLAVLKCKRSGEKGGALAIYLEKTGRNQYARRFPMELHDFSIGDVAWSLRGPRTLVYVRQADVVSQYSDYPSPFINLDSRQALTVLAIITRKEDHDSYELINQPLYLFHELYLTWCSSLPRQPTLTGPVTVQLETDDQETFGLVLFAFGECVWVKIMIPNKNSSFEESTRSISHSELERWRGCDRDSAVLRSGKTVSVALKGGSTVERGEKTWRHGSKSTVEITIDSKGRLMWPGPESMIVEDIESD